MYRGEEDKGKRGRRAHQVRRESEPSQLADTVLCWLCLLLSSGTWLEKGGREGGRRGEMQGGREAHHKRTELQIPLGKTGSDR